MVRTSRNLAACLVLATLAPALRAQSSAPTSKLYPYRFTNFVWWNDSDLRLALKHKLPHLTDTLVPFGSQEGEVRLALIELLKTKGIHADVQVFDPPEQAAPPETHVRIGMQASKMVWHNPSTPYIAFTIAAPPEILVGDVSIDNVPPEMQASIQSIVQRLNGSPFGRDTWVTEFKLHELFQSSAYLSSTESIIAGAPARTSPGHYVVPCSIKIDLGPVYHIASISIDAGPLFPGQDFSNYVPAQPGDVVDPRIFTKFLAALRSAYLRAGYARVQAEADPVLDNEKALVSYNVHVEPGLVYHLHTLTILNLDPAREQAVRDALDIKPGDPYNQLALGYLFAKLHYNNPLFAGYTFGSHPQEDEKNNLVDLTITFDPPR